MSINLSPVNEAVVRWGNRKDYLIEVLQDLQDHYNYLPEEVLVELSQVLQIPLNNIFEVATFYKAFSLVPKGKYQINVCLGTACHVQGAMLLCAAFEREVGLKMGETDQKLEFTLDTVRCIGCCGLAPVVTVNKDVHGKLTSDKVANVVDIYKKELKGQPENKGN